MADNRFGRLGGKPFNGASRGWSVNQAMATMLVSLRQKASEFITRRAIGDEDGEFGEILAQFQLFQVAAQFGGGGGFWGVFVGTGGVPDEFAEGEGDFTFAAFVGEGLGVEDEDGLVL